MAAVLSPHSTSPPPRSSPGGPTSNPSLASLPPLVTSPSSRPGAQRAPSFASKRLSTLSQFSSTSNPYSRSRPQSTVFPIFHSSLNYTLVRDFAYGPLHPLFYGPLPEQPSELSTPASEAHHRRLSDPPPVWGATRGEWAPGPWEPGERLPQTSFGDGPPWNEDDDLHSPVVTSSRHKKHKSHIGDWDRGRSRGHDDMPRRASNPPAGAEYITFPPDTHDGGAGGGAGHPMSALGVPLSELRRDSHFATTLPNRAYANDNGHYSDEDMSDGSPGSYSHDESRFSRDYQFTIASPAEEMHGKAVALFDFAPENDNELQLIEGQIILVSYRHGQGWLVAQDPKSGESGLVPEEYVRLLRDIEGGWHGLMNGQANDAAVASPTYANAESRTPTQAEHKRNTSAGSTDFYTPVVSTFSTSSKDLDPYPQHLLEAHIGTSADGSLPRRHSEDIRPTNDDDEKLVAGSPPKSEQQQQQQKKQQQKKSEDSKKIDTTNEPR